MSLSRFGLLVSFFLLSVSPTIAQPAPDSASVTQEQIQEVRSAMGELNSALARLGGRVPRGQQNGLGTVLFLFLAVAVVFESAMSAIFDWRIYLRHLQGRGFKTPILVGAALLVCVWYDLDIVNRILTTLGRQSQSHFVGTVLTALLISGGSSAVFRVYSKLGIRSPAERKRKAQEERQAMAVDESASGDGAS